MLAFTPNVEAPDVTTEPTVLPMVLVVLTMVGPTTGMEDTALALSAAAALLAVTAADNKLLPKPAVAVPAVTTVAVAADAAPETREKIAGAPFLQTYAAILKTPV